MIATHSPLTLADLHHARDLYGGTLTETAGAWTLVGAVMAGTAVTLGPVRVVPGLGDGGPGVLVYEAHGATS